MRRSEKPSRRCCGLVALAILGILAQASCATYTDRIRTAQRTITTGNLERAVAELDSILRVNEPGALPQTWGSSRALIVLERGILQQALEKYSLSARDFGAADKQIELLDIAADATGTIGKYIYSDSVTNYRASPTEKLSLNAFNMLNYLARHDLAGARVEAKRFTVIREYLGAFDPRGAHGAFGSYLAGFVFEQRGEYGAAMRYYDEALEQHYFRSLERPVRRVSALTAYRSSRIEALLREGKSGRPDSDEREHRSSELLVAVSVGRVPYKVSKRMPIGAAVGLAGAEITGDLTLLEYGVAKFINYPELAEPRSVFRAVSLSIDGNPVAIELASDLGTEIRHEYERLRHRIIAAAVSRMLTRAAVAEGARAAGRKAGEDAGWKSSRILGFLAALLTESAMVAADRPDTRSWQSLPHRVYVYRAILSPGRHTVIVGLHGAHIEQRHLSVDLRPGDYAALVVTAPR